MIDIIPAIDIIGGKCVRLSQGDYTRQKTYNENPLEVAKQFEDAGIKRLHLVDLDGAKRGAIMNLRVLESIAVGTDLVIDFGGGIKSDADIESVFNAGAEMAAVGSIAVRNSKMLYSWIKRFGTEKILLGADVRNEKITVNGWTEQTEIAVFDFVRTNLENGVRNFFCTDISRDGMMQGASSELYRQIVNTCFIPAGTGRLIASGGISSIKDIEEVMNAGCKGVIIGKAIYEGSIRLSDLKVFL